MLRLLGFFVDVCDGSVIHSRGNSRGPHIQLLAPIALDPRHRHPGPAAHRRRVGCLEGIGYASLSCRGSYL
jgi:hypothetical protein